MRTLLNDIFSEAGLLPDYRIVFIVLVVYAFN